MASKLVKCYATGETILRATAYKASDSHWYKDESTYKAYIKGKTAAKTRKSKASKHKQSYHDAVDILAGYLGLSAGEPFPVYLIKKLKEFSYYDDDVLLETVMQNKNNIEWALKSKTFNTTIGKINYIMAILSNHISDVNKQWQRQQERQSNQRVIETAPADFESEILNSTTTEVLQNSNKAPQDVSDLLGGDDLWT